MGEQDQYLLGYRGAEQDRLQRQALELADDSAWLFERVGVSPGDSVVEIGCGPRGCLDLLAALVGSTGKVVGVERSDEAVSRARQHVADQRLENVEVRVGDGRNTGLHRDAFDLVTSRLVLVNVPQPEELVAEAVAITKPGGVVAYHEAVWPTTFDPPLDAWDRLYSIFHAYADGNGIDLFIGRRVPRLLREHGLVDVQARPLTHLYQIGDARRTLMLEFANNLSDRFVADNLVDADELDELKAALKGHLDNPDTLVISSLYVQAWGRK